MHPFVVVVIGEDDEVDEVLFNKVVPTVAADVGTVAGTVAGTGSAVGEGNGCINIAAATSAAPTVVSIEEDTSDAAGL